MDIFKIAEISSSGMQAERMRMEVVANNIANANTTRGPDGEPYRRKQVLFATALDQAGTALGSDALGGVQVVGIVEDQSDFQLVYDPGHPDADEQGYVKMPNVSVPVEMVDLVTAVRAYEANLKVMRMFRQMAERTLQLLRT